MTTIDPTKVKDVKDVALFVQQEINGLKSCTMKKISKQDERIDDIDRKVSTNIANIAWATWACRLLILADFGLAGGIAKTGGLI